ncbi:MAG TPA: hypothetical protein VKP65_24825 [Rhodothermales bacterium]|nr:hypothetical protein [Rhodothermales bacterium]
MPFVLQDLHNPSSKIGITQNQVGGTATMELMTSDSDGDLAGAHGARRR